MKSNFTLALLSKCVNTSEAPCAETIVLQNQSAILGPGSAGSSFKLAFLLAKEQAEERNLSYRTNQR